MKTMRWDQGWRESVLSQLDDQWDVLVIGGGITGAGVFRAAVSAGLKTLLVEANDFAFGTSSRSSKLVHGGFRYLYNRQYQVTYESVTERERLLAQAPCLVEPLAFNLPNYKSYHFPSWLFRFGLGVYDLMAGKWDHSALPHEKMRIPIPGLAEDGYVQGFRYKDAVLDDARLVFRIIRETVQDGGTAINYLKAVDLLRGSAGGVSGAVLQDAASSQGTVYEVHAGAVINAAGPWGDTVRKSLRAPERLRPLRGSHIILSSARLPVREAVTFFHPHDKRAMFVIPWEGTTMVGTTDIDHSGAEYQPDPEPFASREEIDYILAGASFLFPNSALDRQDILSTFAGLRPVIDTGAATPSKESRAHHVWEEQGLVTVSGGKLTTFRIMAYDTLALAGQVIGRQIRIDKRKPMLKPLKKSGPVRAQDAAAQRLLGRSGQEAVEILRRAPAADLESVDGLPTTWIELKWAAESEAIIHLDDLLLRRTRIGLLLPEGGRALLPSIRRATQLALRWSDPVWNDEEKRYLDIWKRFYGPEPG